MQLTVPIILDILDIKDNRNIVSLASKTNMKGGNCMYSFRSSVMERKIINVTGKRQITIPLKFYEKLRFGKEVECFLTDDVIVLRPLSNSDDEFTMEILKDLVAQGYSGDELIARFAEQRDNIKKAIRVLIDEADEIAEGKRKSATTKDIFGEE
jgi:bifunctional DNA-binding transcriptional regulator/antitoxin component of YhaV-PrlF toxin-antitoxin module